MYTKLYFTPNTRTHTHTHTCITIYGNYVTITGSVTIAYYIMRVANKRISTRV